MTLSPGRVGTGPVVELGLLFRVCFFFAFFLVLAGAMRSAAYGLVSEAGVCFFFEACLLLMLILNWRKLSLLSSSIAMLPSLSLSSWFGL